MGEFDGKTDDRRGDAAPIAGLEEAAIALLRGDALIFPTDTVWGIGVSVFNRPSPNELYRLKGREAGKPIAWLVGDGSDIRRFGRDIPDYATILASRFWPGPLTLVVKASEIVPEAYRSDRGTIGLRVPDSDICRGLIRMTGSPIAATSANLSGRAPIASSEPFDIQASGLSEVPVLDAPVECACSLGTPSSVIDCTGDSPALLRGDPGRSLIGTLSDAGVMLEYSAIE